MTDTKLCKVVSQNIQRHKSLQDRPCENSNRTQELTHSNSKVRANFPTICGHRKGIRSVHILLI